MTGRSPCRASRVQRQKCKCPRTSTLIPRLHPLFQLSTARPWSLDSFFFSPRHQLLASRLSTLDSSSGLRAGEFFAVKDVSFELRRGELRTPGRSEKEISKKCLGATKVPASGRRRHQCLGLIALDVGLWSLDSASPSIAPC